MSLAWLIALALAAPCPSGGDVLASLMRDAGRTRRSYPDDLVDQLASMRAAAVASTLFGPVELGEDLPIEHAETVTANLGAVAVAFRCNGTAGHPGAACDLVVAHLAGGDARRLELSGVVASVPVRGRGRAAIEDAYAVTGVGLRDLAGDDTPELVVRWRVGDASYVAAFSWLGFGRVFGPERVSDGDCAGTLSLTCEGATTELARACPDGEVTRWRYDVRQHLFVRMRR